MASFDYLADGHHVDDAGNLIACTYVDFRDPAERLPITALRKASSTRHADPDCDTIRISKPACFLGQGEGIAGDGESHHAANGWIYCAPRRPLQASGERVVGAGARAAARLPEGRRPARRARVPVRRVGGGRAGGRHAGSRCRGGAGRRDGEAAAGAGRQRLRARAGGVLVAGAGRDAAGLRWRRRRGRATWRRRPAIRARRWPAYAAVEALREAVDAADAGCRRTWQLRRGTPSRCCGSSPRRWVAGSPACG